MDIDNTAHEFKILTNEVMDMINKRTDQIMLKHAGVSGDDSPINGPFLVMMCMLEYFVDNEHFITKNLYNPNLIKKFLRDVSNTEFYRCAMNYEEKQEEQQKEDELLKKGYFKIF